VEALETVGETNILSSPRIMAVNNQEARILVGSTEPYVTSTTTTPSSGPTTTAESVNFIDVGVKLYVTPTIHEDDFITMKIRPEVSSVTSNLTTSNNNTIPIVETSEAETVVNVKDGVSVIIGGLIKEEAINTTKKVPLLGNIPILGMAFRSTNNSKSKTEIVIFLTPRIVSGDVEDQEQLAAF
jgi:general secretion pathway protein D